MERLAAEKAKKALIPPAEMFLGDDRYSKYDDEGVPTHDKEGEPLSKSARKKVKTNKAFTQVIYCVICSC